ncbi:MAG: hypothetical protein ACWA45_05590 [Flavobacteriales bacterium]
MIKNYFNFFFISIFLILNSSCSSDDNYTQIEETPVSPVVYNLEEMPYPKLSDYNFYNGDLHNLEPVYGVLPYEPINSPFEEYTQKKRFIWMPNNVKANYVNDYSALNFPVGAILIINFYYNNVQPNNTTQIIETRLLIKKQEDWVLADYIWNNEQTEAFYSLEGGFTEIEWIQNGINKNLNYRIPGESECITCHKVIGSGLTPIVPKPQNLDKEYTFDDGSMNQLDKWVEMGYLENNYPNTINHVINWKDTSQDINLRARSYFDSNCSHCHSDTGHCDYRQLRFAFKETENPIKMGVCLDADTQILGLTKIVIPSDKENSILFNRVNTVEEQIRMPLIGRSLLHEEGIELIEQWINSLTNSCD